jgi:NAD(P)-dependent dehydrogenase (short-subunit alcohol dehydrogenase family)
MAVPSFRLDDKIVVVTGASKGLGRAMALGFAASGADVVVSSRRVAACEQVADEIRALGRRALAVGCHVASWDECEKLITEALAEFGALDVLVNNAGIAPVPPSLAEVSEDLFDKTIGVDLKGPLRLMGLAASVLRPGGSIINISSKASIRPSPQTVVYSAAKAGLNALTAAAAQELGPKGIRVNAIVCGPFHTDSFDKQIPTPDAERAVASRLALGRIGVTEDVVGTAVFLASEASSYMTGTLVSLDGGGG